MFRIFSMVLVLGLLPGWINVPAWAKDPPVPEQPGAKPASESEKAGLGEFVIGKPIAFKNISIFPVASKTPRSEDRYMTLEEGLKAESIQVYEVGAEPAAVERWSQSRHGATRRPRLAAAFIFFGPSAKTRGFGRVLRRRQSSNDYQSRKKMAVFNAR